MSIFSFDWQTFLTNFMVGQGSTWLLLMVMVIVFFESACIFTPFLPGDSLLVMVAFLLARYHQGILMAALGVLMVTILGYQLNFWIAKRLNQWCISKRFSWMSRHEQRLELVKDVFNKQGIWLLMVGRFTPIVRTYMPFFCGVTGIKEGVFIRLNILGACLWVGLLMVIPFLMGQVTWVHDHMHWFILGVMLVSLIPLLVTAVTVFKRLLSRETA